MNFEDAPDGQLHSFDLHFPLPLRIVLIILLGIWGWGLNLHICSLMKIDIETLFRYKRRENHSIYYSIYRFSFILTALYSCCLCFFWYSINHNRFNYLEPYSLTKNLDIIPWLTFIGFFAIIFYPGLELHGRGRRVITQVLGRVLVGSLDKENRLADVIMADILTSYSKVLVDMGIMGCMLFNRMTCVALPDRSCGKTFFVPLITMVPFLIRLRQCSIDYSRDPRSFHVFNGLKYFTSIIVIFLSAIQRNPDGEGGKLTNTLWTISIFINSLYSFFWDVSCDWNLSLLISLITEKRITYKGLRKTLIYKPVILYYIAIALDLCLRLTWSLKLSSHWYHITDFEAGVFMLEIMEVGRRWVWIFFKIESEWIKALTHDDRSYKGESDIPLHHLASE
ncbi:EXS-domain-containing protein [Nadsonia fulvescens var. elongata DSM 6958]|uniref:EXS-domain-containing protein n=1 Tax=Nadsonia fulvescens var. elongata DSM 6958 TaxID=857566 RepID=A0A1E3PJ18_9ASCO|nr:EXS-domain-containing protein [Nadsonia fulvescens var. elongata DSM 6958]